MTAARALTLAAALLAATSFPAAAGDDSSRYARVFDSLGGNVVPVHYTLRLAQSPDGGLGDKVEGVMCGVVTGPDGMVITTADIFPDMDGDPRQTLVPVEFHIRLADGSTYPATTVGVDRQLNLALLRLRGRFPAAALPYASKPPRTGESVLLIGLMGEKYDYAPTFTEARIVGAVDTPRRMYALDALVQDLTIGGLVANLRGQVLGVVGEDILSSSPSGPADLASAGNVLSLFSSLSQGQRPGYPMLFPYAGILDAFIAAPPAVEGAAASRSWLGIVMQPLTEDLSEYWNISGRGGVIIGAVLDGSPAQSAGLMVGDVILEVDHAPVEVREQRDLTHFRDMVQAAGVGREVPVRIFRDGGRQTVALTLGSRPKTIFLAEERRDDDFGFTIKELTFDFLQAVNLPAATQGVFIAEMENASWADVGGLGVNDVISMINGLPVEDLEQFDTALEQVRAERPREVVFFVRRGSRTSFIPVKTDWSEPLATP